MTTFPDCRSADVLYNGRTQAVVGAWQFAGGHDKQGEHALKGSHLTIQTKRFPPHCSWRILSIARSSLQPGVYWAARQSMPCLARSPSLAERRDALFRIGWQRLWREKRSMRTSEVQSGICAAET